VINKSVDVNSNTYTNMFRISGDTGTVETIDGYETIIFSGGPNISVESVSGNVIKISGSTGGGGSGGSKAGIRVVPIATSNQEMLANSYDYYMNVQCPHDLTVSAVTMGFFATGSDNVNAAIYRGRDLTATLVGQFDAKRTIPSTIMSEAIVAESGQNLDFSAGEWMVVGIAMGGTTSRNYGMSVPNTTDICWRNSTDSEDGFPTNPRAKTSITQFPSIEIITS